MILYMYIAPGQGQTAPRGQSFDVNKNVLSLHSFVASFKKCHLKYDFIILYIFFFHDLIHVRGVIDKFVSFFHRIIIYGWIYIIFCHSVVNRKKRFNCKVRQTCDVTKTLMTFHIGDVVVKTLEDRCRWCTLSGCKCCSTSAIIVKFSDIIYT